MNPFRRLLPPMMILVIVVIVGTAGYIFIEGWRFLDALYMVVITLLTIGFQEVHPLTDGGKILTIVIAMGGVGAAIFAASQVIEIIVEGEIQGFRRRRIMEKKIKNMKNHFIICGYGRTGRNVAEQFDATGVAYVVIDRSPEAAAELEEKNIPHITGDVISDENLLEAGIVQARGLIASADSDVANVYVTLSARALNQNLYIVARSSELETEKKMKMAGANRVVSPYFISGKRMATYATKPVASDFLDMVTHGGNLEFSLAEISVLENSSLIERTLAEAQIRQRSGAMVLAIRKHDGTFDLQPHASTVIANGDTFVVIGTQEQLGLLQRMVA